MKMSLKVKQSFSCRGIKQFNMDTDLVRYHIPKAGDVGIFKVLDPKGNMLVDTQSSTYTLFEGDYIMVAFGSRYATNQYEGYVPTQPVKKCELLARGGVAGSLVSANPTFRGTPASIELVAYATNTEGAVLNTIQNENLTKFDADTLRPKVILSVGTSMDSGKTTTAAYLCGGLKKAGHRVAFIKLTGTAYPKDAQLAADRGADYATDFSALGYPSTYMMPYSELLDVYETLVEKVMAEVQPEYIVMEIADGLLQRETNMLLKDRVFTDTIYSVIFSSGDSLGVLTGVQMLNDWGCAPFAISGLFTASALLINEVQPFVDMPILSLSDILNGKAVKALETMNEHELVGL